MSNSVASAVAIVPDDSEMDSNHNGLKRRQSELPETEEDNGKRRLTSAGKISPEDPLASNTEERNTQPDSPSYTTKPARKEEPSRESRRKSGVPDDKQRSKRLFGALLGNLNASQPNDRAVKRRAGIEARRKAELAKQDKERLEDKQRRLQKLALHRKRRQIFVDEENMHIRHRNLLDIANMLRTETEPKLYYRPWDLLPNEETRIEDQLEETQTRVDKEVADFEADKKKRLAELDSKPNEEGPKDEQPQPQPMVIEAARDDTERVANVDPTDSEPAPKPADPEIDSAHGKKASEVPTLNEAQAQGEGEGEGEVKSNGDVEMAAEKQEEAEDDGDHVVEGDEDNVIY